MSKIENWREELTKLSGLDESAIRECSKLLCAILKTQGSDNSSLPAVRKKQMLEKFMKVARVQVNNN